MRIRLKAEQLEILARQLRFEVMLDGPRDVRGMLDVLGTNMPWDETGLSKFGNSPQRPARVTFSVETADDGTLVQIAIVYDDDNIRIYRNGELYAAYRTKNIDLPGIDNHIAVFGLRHIGAGSGTPLAGAVGKRHGMRAAAIVLQAGNPMQL